MDYPWHQAPATGELVEVASGIFWVRMPLPFALDHINLWLLRDGDGWALIDTGVSNEPIRAAWQTLLGGLDGPLRRVLVTHFHPDHLGLAGWLTESTGAEFFCPGAEWLLGSMLYYDVDGRYANRMLGFFAEHGLGDEWLRRLDTGNRYRRLVAPPPTSFRRLADGEAVTIGGRAWRVMVGHGHSPEHACLYCAEVGVLISGDQILPRITPNISVYASEPFANPLQDYLDSLAGFRTLPSATLVLPAHGFPFRGLHERLDYLIEHHDDRFTDLLRALRAPIQAADLVPVLFRRQLDAHQMMFAMGETLAHLACLLGRAKVKRHRESGGWWFVAASDG